MLAKNSSISTELQLGLAIKVYNSLKATNVANVIIEPCALLSSLCVLSKLTDHATAANIYECLKIGDCIDIDAYIKSISVNMNDDAVDYCSRIMLKDVTLDSMTQRKLSNCYKTKLIEHTSSYKVNICNNVMFSAPWNRPFTDATEDQIRKHHDSVNIVSIFIDSKRRFHLLRRLTDLKCSAIRTSLGNNNYILTTIIPDTDDDEIFSNLEERITLTNLLDWIDNTKMKKTQHRFKFPEIMVNTSCDLVSIFRNMGLDLTTTRFRNIIPEVSLYLDTMIQINNMEVTANKLSLESKTDIGFKEKYLPRVDRYSCNKIAVGKPFVFIIQCRRTGDFLYFGVMKDSF